MESSIKIKLVHGGFILTTGDDNEAKTEVFTSQSKLMKAIRTAVDAQSLVKKERAEDVDDKILQSQLEVENNSHPESWMLR